MEAPKRQNRLLVYAVRAAQAAVFVLVNYAIFFIAPSLFFSTVGLLTAEVEAAISSYFLIIGCLTVIHILVKDHIIGFASSVSLSIVQAIYIFVITNGGVLSITYSGLTLTLEFKPLLYLMIAMPLVNMVKQIYDYAARSAMQPTSMIEVEG
ncbi:MAG: hypothetical protein QXN08_06945 [Nitrososphaerales archaeon]